MELYYGIYRTAEPQSKLEQLNELLEALGCQILPVTDETVLHAARIKVACERAGRRQQDFDILIAATALEHDFTLVTRNTKHFEVVAGLRLSEN